VCKLRLQNYLDGKNYLYFNKPFLEVALQYSGALVDLVIEVDFQTHHQEQVCWEGKQR